MILLNGSVPEVPDSLLAQLKEGGRLCAIIAAGREGRPRQGKATLFVKVDGEASGLPHFDANARALPGFAPSPALPSDFPQAFPRLLAALLLRSHTAPRICVEIGLSGYLHPWGALWSSRGRGRGPIS